MKTEVLIAYIVVALILAGAYYYSMMKLDKDFDKDETLKMAGIIAAIAFILLFVCGESLCVDKSVGMIKSAVTGLLNKVPKTGGLNSPNTINSDVLGNVINS